MAVSFIGGVPGENHRPVESHWQTLLHNVVLSMNGVPTHNFSGVSTDCTGSCKSNYDTITTTTARRTLRREFNDIGI